MFIKLMKMKSKIIDYVLPAFTKSILSVKLVPESFNIFIDTKCLVLAPRPGDETFAMGGFMAKHPKNFEVLSITDGCLGMPNKDKVDARFARRKEFNNVMETLRVKGHKIFDIEEGKLYENYNKFSKLDVSEIDYIFIPNIFEQNTESRVLLAHLKRLLNDKEHKKTLKIVFYELLCPLPMPNCTVDVTLTLTLKQDMMKMYTSYYSQSVNPEAILFLNRYRSSTPQGYNESFMVMSYTEFNSLTECLDPKNTIEIS